MAFQRHNRYRCQPGCSADCRGSDPVTCRVDACTDCRPDSRCHADAFSLLNLLTHPAADACGAGDTDHFRELPSTNADIITGYDRGKELTILGIANGWTKVLIDGRTGYIKSEYVSDVYVAPDNALIAGGEQVNTYTDNMVIAGYSASDYGVIQSRIIQLTNEQRAANGLPALTADSRLQTAADIRAAEQPLAFSHTRPDGSDWSTAFPPGTFYFLGENLASCDTILTDESFASSCVKWWMESTDHRANILNSLYTSIAVGVCISGNSMYAVQVFGTPY